MKKPELFFFSAVLLSLLLVFACSKKNPAEPGQNTPTVTMTSCIACTDTDTPTATVTLCVVCTATSTPTVTATTLQNHYNFDSGSLDSWATGGWGGATSCAAISASVAAAPTPYATTGPNAAKLDYNLTAACDNAVLTLTFSQPVNLTGKAIIAHVWAPASLVGDGTQYGANIGIFGSSNEQSGTGTMFTSSGWYTLTWAPSLMGEDAVTKITIMVGKVPAAPDASGSVYIDEIVWF